MLHYLEYNTNLSRTNRSRSLYLAMEPYVYRPLRKAPHSTRLLQLMPGMYEAEIHCLISDYTIPKDLASSPYEASFYIWGDSDKRQRISVRNVEPSSGMYSADSFVLQGASHWKHTLADERHSIAFAWFAFMKITSK
jgi:hypothetical protein